MEINPQKHTTKELEELLQFTYLSQIDFESQEDRQEVLTRGLDQDVKEEALDLGKQYIKQIDAAYIPNVSVHFINEEVGFGLFAKQAIEEGSYVGEYTGIVRRNDRRYSEPFNHYCYEYPVPDEIGRHFVIDATEGNLTRFINHSSAPNLKPIHVFYEGYYHLIFLAIQPIEIGTQLFYDYGKTYWYIRQPPADWMHEKIMGPKPI